MPVCEMLPLGAPPTTLQVTAVFVVPDTAAVNCCVLLTDTLALVGAMVTEIADGLLLAQPIMAALINVSTQMTNVRRMDISVRTAGPRREMCREPTCGAVPSLDYVGGEKGCVSGGSVSKKIPQSPTFVLAAFCHKSL